MTNSGIVSAIVLVLLFALQIHSKSVPSLRMKRAPPIEINTRILQHPRLGGKRSTAYSRNMPIEINTRMLQHPRLGGKRSSSVETTTYSLDDLSLDDLDPAIKDKFIELFMNMVAEASNNRQTEGQKHVMELRMEMHEYFLRENFLAYPRQGRSSKLVEFSRLGRAAWHYPRMGRSWSPDNNEVSGLEDLSCCPKGIKTMVTFDSGAPHAICPADKCCEGLREETKVSDDTTFVYSVCLSDEIGLLGGEGALQS